MEFHTSRNDSRKAEELNDVAAGLLRGCQQHFRANVTRLKKVHGVVAVGQEAAFESRTLALLDAPNHEGFLELLKPPTKKQKLTKQAVLTDFISKTKTPSPQVSRSSQILFRRLRLCLRRIALNRTVVVSKPLRIPF